MVVPESEAASQGEVESPLQLQGEQHNLGESGKNFESMYMDDFLNSIWTAEENQAQALVQPHPQAQAQVQAIVQPYPQAQVQALGQPHPQAQAQFQALVQPYPQAQAQVQTLGQLHPQAQTQVQALGQPHPQAQAQAQAQVQAQVQPHPYASASFGEMTLEDFLVQGRGVVGEQGNTAPRPYAAMYPNPNNNTTAIAPTYVAGPVMGLGGGAVVPAYQPLPQGGVVYGGSAVGYPLMQGLGLGSPVSPVSSDGLCVNPGGDGGNHYGLETGIRGGRGRGRGGGRKRIIDVPVEVMVERRQRRMVKNRESAVRSRDKKQAYTAELEEEVNQLKEENASLKQALAEMDMKRKQQAFEEVNPTTPTNEKLRLLRRTMSCPL